MLPFRLFLFTLLAGLCLWGLFALLDNLHEPELLRSPKAVAVKGCDPIESEAAERLCPELLCQKALLDGKQVAWSSRFEVTLNKKGTARRLIGGTARAADDSQAGFACVLENSRVIAAHSVDGATLSALAAQPDGWVLEDER